MHEVMPLVYLLTSPLSPSHVIMSQNVFSKYSRSVKGLLWFRPVSLVCSP